jgi:hypothetical protein
VPGGHPLRHAGEDEPESDRATAESSDADTLRSSEIPSSDHN